MAGHSKWSSVRHIKGALDVKRGKLFNKLSRKITVAAQLRGGDPASNPRLRSAMSMPDDNDDRRNGCSIFDVPEIIPANVSA